MTLPVIPYDTFWTVGDAELISADNVRFKIDLSRLSSEKLRGLMWPPIRGVRTFAFANTKFETAPVIRSVLEVEMAPSSTGEGKHMYRIPPSFPRDTYPIMVLLRFLVQWNCVRGFDNFVDAFIEYLRDCDLGWPRRYFNFLRRSWKDDKNNLILMLPMLAAICIERQKHDERTTLAKQWRREMRAVEEGEAARPQDEEKAEIQGNSESDGWDEEDWERPGFA